MKLVYWISKNLYGSPCYNIRALTKAECVRIRIGRGVTEYGAPHKVSIEHYSKLDLVQQCMGEGHQFLER
jgi:hypothetical protein